MATHFPLCPGIFAWKGDSGKGFLEILQKVKKNEKFFLHLRKVSVIINKLFNQICISEEVQHKMAKCEFCDEGVTFGIQVSHSHRRSNRTWKPNVKRVKVIMDGTPKHAYACTRCLRSGKVTRAV